MRCVLLLGVLIVSVAQPHAVVAQMCYDSSMFYESVSVSTVGYLTQTYYQSCGFLGWGTCTRYKIVSQMVYESVPQAMYKSVAICCAGYEGSPPDCTPVCDSPACINGECQAPDTCQCYSGWSGDDCNSPVCTFECTNGACTAPDTCTCDTGFTGDTCSQDIDECLEGTHNCFSSDHCVNNNGSFSCTCPPGYTLDMDGYSCTDVNECDTGNGGCDHNCTNLIGSYTCSCHEGFFLDGNMHSCLDHDECSSPENNCAQVCVNHDGYFTCDCYPGCLLETNNVTCVDIDECSEDPSVCDHNCTNANCTDGRYSCSCDGGYTLQPDGHTCRDDDECSSGNGGCDQICTNLPGSHECSCSAGYVLENDSVSCTALPCSLLVDPDNGVLVCTGPQVTDESCTVECSPGFQTTGTAIVECLPSGNWSSNIASCPPKLCGELVAEENAQLVIPCYREFGSTCSQVCVDGYYLVNGTSFERTCSLQGSDEVGWTDPGECQEILPCSPSPCEHGGTCSASDAGKGEPLCECPTTYAGDYCESLVVRFPTLPFLTLNTSYSFTIYASPDSTTLSIEIITSASVDVSPSNLLQVLPGETNVTFQLTAHVEGTFQVSYALQLSDGTAMSETAVVTAGTDSPDDYFNSLGLPNGKLGLGCCAFASSSLESLCPSLPSGQLSLASSCSWTDSDDGASFATAGVTFISSQGLNLPLSIAGTDGTVQDGISLELPSPALPCAPCTSNTSSTEGCYQYEATPGYVADMLSSNALLRTFLGALMDILPQGASIELEGDSEDAAAYQPFDYQAAVTSVSAGNMAGSCKSLNLPDGVYYILKTTVPLRISLDSEDTLTVIPSDPVCFAISICHGLLSSVVMDLGEEPPEFLFYPAYLDDLYLTGFDFTLQSVELSAQGLDSLNGIGFWNGSGRYEPSVPSYDLRMQVLLLTGDFGTAISASLQFSGAVSLPLSQSYMILSRYHGSFQLSFNIPSLNSTITLQSENEDGVYVSAGSVVSGDGVFQRGWGQRNLKVPSPQPLSITGLFAQAIDIPATDFDSCLFDAYTILDHSLEVEQVSFVSDCAVVRLGSLDFANMEHSFIVSRTSSGEATIKVMSSPLHLPLSLGKFMVLEDVGDSASRMTFSFSEEGVPYGSLFLAEVSVFDTRVLTSLSITDSQLTFQENVTIFDHYRFDISGQLLASEAWDSQLLHLIGEAHSSSDNFLQDLNLYIHSVIDSRVIQTVERIARASESVEEASASVQMSATKLNQTLTKYTERLSEYLTALANAEYLNTQNQLNATAYQNALDAFNVTGNLTAQVESTCSLRVCEQLCVPESTMDVCYKQFSLALPDTCFQSNPIDIVTVQSTPYLSHGCIDQEVCTDRSGVTWVVSSYTSGDANASISVSHPLSWKDQRCYQNCVPMAMTAYSYQHIMTESQQTVNYVCDGSVYNSSVLYVCVSGNSCISYADDQGCSNANAQCLTLRNETLIAGLDASQQEKIELNDLFSSYRASSEEAAAARLVAESLQDNLTVTEQILQSLHLSYNESILAYDVSVLSYQQVLADLQDDLLLVQWLGNYSTSDNLIQVTDISFDVSVDSDIVSEFPVLVTYKMPYSGVTEQTAILVDFSAPVELVRDLIGSDVTQHALEMVAAAQLRRRKSVTKRQSEESTTNTFERFEINCNYLRELMAYYAQLNTTIYEKHNETVQAETNIIGTIDQLEAVISAISPDSLPTTDPQLEYYDLLLSSYNQLLEAASAGELSSWRSRMDALHNSTGSLVDLACFSFSDCQKITVMVLFNIIEDTPPGIAGTLLTDLSGIDSSLSVLTSSDNLLFANAVSIITSTFEFIRSVNDTGYWCALPPSIILHPSPQESVELGSSLVLHCEAQSTIPLSYSWIKDNVTVPSSSSPTLTIDEIGQDHVGTYICEVSNAVATRQSTPSVVSFYQQPIITKHPSDVATYVGDENGAQFSCQAQAYPVLQWFWFHLPLGSTIWVEVGNSSSVLVVSAPYREQEGLYRCTADNSLDFGEETSQSASLVLLPFTVTKVRYSVEFAVAASDPSITKEGVGNVVASFLANEISLNGSTIGPISAETIDNGFKVFFSLLGANVTTTNTIYDSLESISKDLTGSLADLEIARAELQALVSDSNSSLATTLSSSLDLVPGSLFISYREYLCPEGQGLHDNYVLCVSCAPGRYWNGYAMKSRSIEAGSLLQESVPQCSSCPHGYYQPAIGSLHCIQCPKYYSTVATGTKSPDQCLALCSPNTSSANGFVPCQSCDLGTYLPLYGSTLCFSCPQDSDDDEQCSKEELEMSSSAGPTSPSATPTTAASSFEFTFIIIGSGLGMLACVAFLSVIVCLICVYNKKMRKKVVFSENCDRYHYVGVNRPGINGFDSFKKPLDSDYLSNNPMYEPTQGDYEKEVYTEVRNTIYEEPSGAKFSFGELPEKLPHDKTATELEHMYDTPAPYLKPTNSKPPRNFDEDSNSSLTAENPLYGET